MNQKYSGTMFLRHRYQSPEASISNPYKDKDIQKLQSPELARYSSARILDRISLSGKQLQSAIRKRIQDYTYSLSDLIGEGYTSRVFKAHKDGCKQNFAIKVVDLRKYTVSNRQMLQSEVNILKQLDHPNVIRCFDVFVTTNNCYIVTEYCEGGDLSALLKRTGKKEALPQHRFATIAKEILAGFRYLGNNNIVHRDLKPANIFFKDGVVKIADFGFAKKLQSLKTKESYNVGTPLYMPPEALVYSKYSLQSDIFSLGVLFYQILFGHAPWQSRSEKQLIAKMTKNPVVFSHQIAPSLKDMLNRCIAIQITQRFTFFQLFSCEYVKNMFPQAIQLSPITEKPKKQLTIQKQESLSTKSTARDSTSKQQIPSPITSISPVSIKIATNKRLHLDRNTNIILVQLNFCRFMYYLYRNRIPVMKSTEKDKLNLILHKHILKVIGRLVDMTNFNTLCLPDYEDYKNTSAFTKISDTVAQYNQRYKSEFLNARAKQSLKYMHLIQNQLQPIPKYDLTGNDRLFYEQIQLRVKQMAKNLSTTLQFEVVRSQGSKNLTSSIQGLKSLLKYLSLLKIMCKKFQDYEHFMINSSINVLTDYTKSTATTEDFFKIKNTNV